MITNNDIRRFLGVPESIYEFNIDKVDSAGVNANTLMFINNPDFNLFKLDYSVHSVYLIDECYGEFSSGRNDFITLVNPKYYFCKIVEHFKLESTLQLYIKDPSNPLQECMIGKGCQIDQGAIIGGTDFSPVIGTSREEIIQFPQMGGVKLGDNVVVKYNSMIGKGTFGYTDIGDNTMIDFGCQVGHNCIVGKSCIIAAGTIIGGSTTIGDNTTIGIGVMVRNGLKIGKNVSIGMGSVVVKDLPDNSVVIGNPARIINHKTIFDERGLV